MSMRENVPRDLLYMQRCYQWLYSESGSDLQAAATEGSEECQRLMNKLSIHINTIEHWQLNDRFDRAHYEVEQLRRWFTPIMDLKC